MKASAVIVCAGNSTRMGGVNKILLPLGERKVIGVTMQAFQACESICEIVIVAREADIPAILSILLLRMFHGRAVILIHLQNLLRIKR